MSETHHLVPKNGVPTCIYCSKTYGELVLIHGTLDVTTYECPDAPR